MVANIDRNSEQPVARGRATEIIGGPRPDLLQG